MGQRTVRCGCGASFPIPELPPSVLHCPRCGDRMTFGSAGGESVKVRQEIREPIKPLPPGRPYFTLYLLVSGGLLIAAGLVGSVVYFSRLERRAPLELTEGVRAKPRIREPEPVLSIRAIPSGSEPAKAPSDTLTNLSTIASLTPEAPVDLPALVAKAQQLSVRANLTGLVLTILECSGNGAEYQQLEKDLVRIDEDLRSTVAPIADRPEVRSMKDYFKPGDELSGLGIVARDPRHPLLFAEAIRSWLSDAQGGALVIATISRDGRAMTLSMWFPEFEQDLLKLVLPGLRKGKK